MLTLLLGTKAATAGMAPFLCTSQGIFCPQSVLSPHKYLLHLPHRLYFSSLDSGHQRLSPLSAFFGEMTTWDATICHIYLNYLQFWSFCFQKEVIPWADFWQVPGCGSCPRRDHGGNGQSVGVPGAESRGLLQSLTNLVIRQHTKAACWAQCALSNCLFTSRLWLSTGSYQ